METCPKECVAKILQAPLYCLALLEVLEVRLYPGQERQGWLMSSRSAATQSKDTPSTVAVNIKKDQVRYRVNERIAGRAYDLYQQEGNRHGEDMRHWLQAESEILSSVPEIRESSS